MILFLDYMYQLNISYRILVLHFRYIDRLDKLNNHSLMTILFLDYMFQQNILYKKLLQLQNTFQQNILYKQKNISIQYLDYIFLLYILCMKSFHNMVDMFQQDMLYMTIDLIGIDNFLLDNFHKLVFNLLWRRKPICRWRCQW